MRIRERLRAWLIRRLGGYTEGDLAFRDAKIRMLSQAAVVPMKFKASLVYFVNSEQGGSRPEEENARAALAEKLARKLMEDGMISVHKALEPWNEQPPIKRMRITGTIWAVKKEEEPW